MPTYLYECQQHGEFEEFHSMSAVLKDCPKCVEEKIDPPHEVKKLINCGTRGIVELTGHEFDAKLKEDIRQLKSDLPKSEKMYANFLGESKYQELQVSLDKGKRNRR
jgi:putative FmdB family regulatory protein